MAMNAITLLKEDHRTVEKLFKRFEKAGIVPSSRSVEWSTASSRSSRSTRRSRSSTSTRSSRATVPGAEDMALESLEEHHIVKWVLHELEDMEPADERFDAKVTVLIENVRHHVDEEEGELFPKVRDELGRSDLGELGDAMEAAKKVAPTHPHPSGPDTPPANLVVGLAAGCGRPGGGHGQRRGPGRRDRSRRPRRHDPPPQEAEGVAPRFLPGPGNGEEGAGQRRIRVLTRSRPCRNAGAHRRVRRTSRAPGSSRPGARD